MLSLFYIVLCLLIVLLCARPLGTYMAEVYSGGRTWMTPVLGWLERGIYKISGINPEEEMTWGEYATAMVLFSLASILLIFTIFMLQGVLPLNPQGVPGLSADLALNAALAFISNTDWQSYSGEVHLSYFSQMVGCAVQNFLAAAVGMAVAVALFRGFARKQSKMLGNFWVDVVRCVLYILLPVALLFALVLVSQGVVQNLDAYVPYVDVESSTAGLMAQGPAASQVAIKMLGSGGGGFFNANGAHPFENPTPLSNFLQIISILLVPAGLVYCFGIMVGDRRQGWGLLAAMTLLFAPMAFITMHIESSGNPLFPAVVDQSAGNMEGKEVRIGAEKSALWAVAATATSNGATNSSHDSYLPLGSMVPLMFIQFGEVVFGGVGTGMHGMLIYLIITVFVGGLMVGRTPEYLGKKLGAFEVQVAALCVIIPEACVLFGTAIAISTDVGRESLFNPGAQGFTEVLYAFSSAGNNNGSGFTGLAANTPFYNLMLAFCIAAYRFGLMILLLALAGSLAAKNKLAQTAGTLPTHTPLFTIMLVVTILLVDVLTYIPVLALGPITEHMHLFEKVVGMAP